MKLSYTIIAALIIFGYVAVHKASVQATEPHVISWFFIAKSAAELPLDENSLVHIVGVPGAAERAVLRQREIAPQVSGIVVFYAGRMAYSDFNGQTLLPLLEPTDELTIVVCERPTPKILHGNTVESWSISSHRKSESFSLKRSSYGSQFMWDITRAETPQEIPYDAVIILVDPELIEIPVGKWPTIGGVNLILPNIYITGVTGTTSALNGIAISRFFRPTYPWIAYAPERYVIVTT